MVAYGPDTFVVRVEGDWMAPRFRNGDYAYVDPDERMTDGCFVAVRKRAGGATVIRRYAVEGDRRVLRTLSPCRTECVVTVENETAILGVVVFAGSRV